jgi:ribosome-binding factor A
VLDDPDILAAFDRGDGDGDEDETSSRQPQRAEVQQLITFRLGRMPDTVVQPGASGMAAEGMDARGKVRSRRIGGSIQKALVEGLRRGQLGHALQRFRLEIDEVELSGGLRTATIWWHSQGAEIDAQIKAEVELLRGKPRTLIARALNLKFTPQVRWKPTTVRDSSTELDSLFALVETEMDDAKDRGVV